MLFPFPQLWGHRGRGHVAKVAARCLALWCLTTLFPKPAFATSCSLPPQHPVWSFIDTCLTITGEVGKLRWATATTNKNRKIVFCSQTRIHSGDRGPAHRSQSSFLLQLLVEYNMQPHAGACTVVPGASQWLCKARLGHGSHCSEGDTESL